MNRIALFIVFFTATYLVNAQTFEPEAHGELVRHEYYSLSYVEEHEQAEWVYYLLRSEYLSGAARTDNFRQDKDVSTSSAQLSDYKGSGYDRGHLCPAGDMKVSKKAMSETFLMSNMSPQVQSFNRGVWSALEERVRQWAVALDSVYVVTGPVFTDIIDTIGKNKVTVPGYYYKALYSPADTGMMIAFMLPNAAGLEGYSDYEITVDSLERLTGIDLFSQLPDSIENKLEAKSHYTEWKNLGGKPKKQKTAKTGGNQ